MKISIELFVGICYVMRLVGAGESYLYETMHNFGLGRRIIPRGQLHSKINNLYAYPEPLPARKSSPIAQISSPYKSLIQGSRINNDTRVYRRRFDYQPKMSGHQVFCQGLFDCIITHLAIETTEGIPIILRGGAGYRHFMVVVKAKPGNQLRGSIRAYCKKKNPT